MSQTNTSLSGICLTRGLMVAVIRDVVRRWYLILAATLVAAMAAFVYADYSYEPRYSTTATLVVTTANTSSSTYTNLTAASNTAGVLTEVLNSSLLRVKVMEAAGLTSFDGRISAAVIEGTNLLTMTVEGSDPRSVFLIAKGTIEHHSIVSDQVLGNTILEVLQDPAVPTAPRNSADIRSKAMSAALAAAAGVTVLLAMLSIYSDKIRTKEEADEKLSCRVLGELYHERKRRTLKDRFRRQKRSILITSPLTSFVYAEAIHRLSSRVDKRRRSGERVVMVTSLLENEGKSTVAVNLALSMARKGKKTLLIDCDLRKPACGMILGADEKAQGAIEVLRGKALKDCVVKMEDSGLYLLSGRKSLRSATNLLNSPAMGQMLREAAEQFDFVVVDTPPMGLAPDAECISEFVDGALLVVRQNVARAKELNDAISILRQSNAHLLGCVMNNVYGSIDFLPAYGYGIYGKYGKYGKYGRYGYGRRGYGKYHYRNNDGEEEM